MTRLILALSACLASFGAHAAEKIHHSGNFGVSGWLVYWDPKSMQTFEKHASLIDRIYPEWYVVGADSMPQSSLTVTAQKRKTVEIARAHKIQIFSMIVNYDKENGEHSAARVERVLYDSKLRKSHIQALVNNALKDGADGIDIDYENLKAKDAGPFSSFISELKSACLKKNLLLAAALAPKSNAEGSWDGNQAHDYKALANSLDLIRPMTYDEHWGTSEAGPISSPEFTEMVDKYAASVADPGKVELGIAGYGYDWKEKKGASITYDDFMALQAKNKVKARRDTESGELTFKYGDGHEVWFCDAGSYQAKYGIIKRYKLAGLAMWRWGSEDPGFWDDLKKYKFSD